MRSAYKNAVDKAVMSTIYAYYKSDAAKDIKKPNISPEFLKFIKNYKILSRTVSDNAIQVTIEADIDSSALHDAGLLISSPVNTAVFAFTGIPYTSISEKEQISIIESAFSEKNFTTKDQNTFFNNISDMNDNTQLIEQFQNIYTQYLFKFNFSLFFESLKDPDANCELTAVTSIFPRNGKPITLKLEQIPSMKLEKNLCIAETMKKSVAATLNYVRNNLVQTPAIDKQITSYTIQAINFQNMVNINNMISSLKERGFIISYKASSFSSQKIIFQIESYFSKQELAEKLMGEAFSNLKFIYSITQEGIVLDFSENSPVFKSSD